MRTFVKQPVVVLPQMLKGGARPFLKGNQRFAAVRKLHPYTVIKDDTGMGRAAAGCCSKAHNTIASSAIGNTTLATK